MERSLRAIIGIRVKSIRCQLGVAQSMPDVLVPQPSLQDEGTAAICRPIPASEKRKPVIFPPGLGRLSTKPSPAGSATAPNTIVDFVGTIKDATVKRYFYDTHG
jgi:hypothetical protein